MRLVAYVLVQPPFLALLGKGVEMPCGGGQMWGHV
jgi:hypothetical protein